MLDWNKKARISENVVKKSSDGESIILDLKGEVYHGLNGVGTRMLDTVNEASNVHEAFESLSLLFDVDEAVLRSDLDELLQTLTEKNIVEWID